MVPVWDLLGPDMGAYLLYSTHVLREEIRYMQPTDEAALLERAQRNEQAAIGELYDRYSAKIYSYILYRVGDTALAEDLTTSVFIKVLDAIRSQRSWQLSFSGWLYRIAHNAVIDHYRRAQKRETLPLDERLVATGEDPVSRAEKSIQYEAVCAAMHELTEEQQAVIQLKFFEGLSNLEVARALGKTEGAIKSLQFRALGALRRRMEPQVRGQHV